MLEALGAIHHRPTFYVTPGYGDRHLDQLHYRQAVRIGNRVETSGQGGWAPDALRFPDDLADEMAQAFTNVEATLAHAGAGWGDVVAVDSFHVLSQAGAIDGEHTRLMVENLRHHLAGNPPIWTQLGVAGLGAPGMRVEIRVTAVLPGPIAA